ISNPCSHTPGQRDGVLPSVPAPLALPEGPLDLGVMLVVCCTEPEWAQVNDLLASLSQDLSSETWLFPRLSALLARRRLSLACVLVEGGPTREDAWPEPSSLSLIRRLERER